ncbi:MAG: polymerase [Thermoleophilaceae bacterium]|nr:polymerase [Thermoleophilaceae bacterium]
MADAENRELFLIDGNSLVYRAFFALPETIATSKGQPTNAIFGFASMLVKILTEHGPKSTVVVWDAGMSGREKVSADYKAQRTSRPDLLREQWPHMEPLVDAFGYRNVKVDGYEADDVIATLAERAREQGIDVTIVTGDRDAFQLIEDSEDGKGAIKVMATSRGITETKLYDRQAVIDRYGIPPESIPDFYGLKGDTSDNIPGVPGIGDKTASDLLQRFGDLDTVLASVDEISGAKRKENLTNHADDARMSRQLATAVRDVDLDIDLEECLADEPDRARLREVFREFELRAPLERLEEALGEDEAAPREVAATTIEARAREIPPSGLADLDGELATLAAARGEPEEDAPAEGEEPEAPPAELSLDLDAASPRPPLTFAAYAGGEEVLTGEAETLAAITLAWGDRPVVAHDWKSLAASEEPCDAPPLEHDTMVAAYLLDPAGRAYPLDELADREGFGAKIEGSNGDGFGLPARAVVTRALAERQREELESEGLTHLFKEVELPLVDVLVDLERAGIKLDTGRLAEISTDVQAQIETLEAEIHELAGTEFTIGSPQQLGEILFEKLGLSRKRRGKTGFSTDARVLQAIRSEHEIIPKVERWRELSKLKSTYLDALPLLVDERSRLHTTFNQTATTTGRLSSTDPNLQNIPIRTELGREIRQCFVAEEGRRLISVDYSQVELRVLAHVCDEQVLKDIFARGEDVHTATAAEMFGVEPKDIDPGTRSKAKMINFGIVYGLSAYGLADRLDIPQDEAGEFIARYLDRFPRVREYIEKTIEQATEDGYVTTIFGRKRRIPELRSRKWQTRSLGERLAVNTPIQGSAADIIKVAMVRSVDALRDAGLGTRLVLQIHDELLFEAPVAEVEAATEIVVREMAGAYDLDPPLAVDAGSGENWLAAK